MFLSVAKVSYMKVYFSGLFEMSIFAWINLFWRKSKI